ncbi:MAG: Fe-Mn family superoxide dismutase [Candidatus Micrarchaeota archaeon]
MTYEAKNYEHLLGTNGFSETLLKTHFTLYQGYVTNTNKAAELLKKLEQGTPEYAEVKRRFGWEYNGMRLHEYYFGGMINGGNTLDKESELMKKIIEDFGSYENWERDFKATGAMRGIGWVILYYDKCGDRLFNCWINEHDEGHLAGAKPLLVMDVFEHAFITDYGLKKADYLNVFFKAINWEKASQRFDRCAQKSCCNSK